MYTFDKHSKTPEISFDQYLKSKKIELGKSIKPFKKIYLDTKYWLLLRDAYLGRERHKAQIKLLELVCRLKADRQILCPISEDIFVEIIKQVDEETLKASIELIDALSDGVTLVSQEERWKTEVFHFIRSSVYGEHSVFSLKEFVWIKLAYTQGVRTPFSELLSPEQNKLIQKSFLDYMWSLSMSDLCLKIGLDGLKKYPHMPDFSNILNQEKDNYHGKNLSFKEMFLSEIAFIIDFKKNYFKDLFTYFYVEHFGKEPTPSEVARSDVGQKFAKLIYHSFRLGGINNKLPTFDIEAGINAQIIYDIKRKFKHNDIHDINHAVAALPYCDIFLTEKNLKSFITQKNLSYDKKYKCTVISEIDDAIDDLTRTSHEQNMNRVE